MTCCKFFFIQQIELRLNVKKSRLIRRLLFSFTAISGIFLLSTFINMVSYLNQLCLLEQIANDKLSDSVAQRVAEGLATLAGNKAQSAHAVIIIADAGRKYAARGFDEVKPSPSSLVHVLKRKIARRSKELGRLVMPVTKRLNLNNLLAPKSLTSSVTLTISTEAPFQTQYSRYKKYTKKSLTRNYL